MFSALKHSDASESCFSIQALDSLVIDMFKQKNEPFEACMVNDTMVEEAEISDYAFWLDSSEPNRMRYFKDLGQGPQTPNSTIKQTPVLELQPPEHHWYAYLGEASTYQIIISSELSSEEEEKLLRVLRKHKVAIRWVLANIRGISPFFCMH
jgi:hypothetical protein